jgi:hypothetical protein
MTKKEYANAMAILLCLDRGMEQHLMKLPTEVLQKMYDSYIENARRSNG